MKRYLIFILIGVIFLLFNISDYKQIEEEGEDLFWLKRQQMVKLQLQGRDITDPLTLKAMLTVPRHLFVDEKIRDSAYNDYPLPIGEGQTISQPYIVALMTQLLELTGEERVLEIGTGSGYQAAVLAEIAKEVYTVEIYESLSLRSENLLQQLGYKNIYYKIGDGYYGWEEFAPYDAIIVTCAPDHIPLPLIKQLKEEGGRMVIPVGGVWMVQTLMKIEKVKGEVKSQGIMGVRFVPMLGHSK